MLYFVGLGLYDEKDISLKGVEALKKPRKFTLNFTQPGFLGRAYHVWKKC